MSISAAETLNKVAAQISRPEASHLREAQRRLDSLTKPLGSLGYLEEIAARVAAIRAGELALPLTTGVYVFAADHGVTEEGVSAYPREVTRQMVLNFLNGGAAINVLARLERADLTVIDVGVDGELAAARGLHAAKVRNGSRNFAREAAMSEDELSAAIEVGLAMAESAQKCGKQLAVAGEMGIGNTTSASVITSALTEHAVADVTGRGTGLDDTGRRHKVTVIEQALAMHFSGRGASPIEILRRVGGLEIAAMVGFMLGAARARMVILCDGFISTAAAAVAFAIAPVVKEYLFAGHVSEEPGHRYLLAYLGLRPILSLGMRLGEGTGAVLAVPIVQAALRLYYEMATFSSAGVSEASSRCE